jgi:hypothetical protein
LGVLEEGAKAAGGVIDALRTSPGVLATVIMNIVLLAFLWYYLTRITARTETTVAALFTSQDKLFTQWAGMMKDQNALTEKTMHCILPSDVEQLLRIPRGAIEPQRPSDPQRPSAPAPLDRPSAPMPFGPTLRWPISPSSDQPPQWPDPPAVDVPRN